ncbi:MAG: NFACT RNA binding domain-containing protein [Candidatus Diapherotrites archaeon]|nr:NFACT RNA binding domain-containing protein [Candidatus Diapherotrites archaeon]
MKIRIDLTKNLNENASDYFQKGKQAKNKAARILDALKITEKKLKDIQSKQEQKKAEETLIQKRKTEWFEKFRWFYSSSNILVIAGRDAHQNEQLVKKHMDLNDSYFHAEFQGAPHCVVKLEGKKIDVETKNEAAQFAGMFSKAWQEGFASVDVYSVKPEQVSKKAPSGESLGTGAFMIYGEREWFKHQTMECWLGIEKMENSYRIISGSKNSVQTHALVCLKLVQGSDKPGNAAKQIKKWLDYKVQENKIGLDEIIRMMPSENIRLVLPKA